jgi:NADPH:quinone reductase-like Zn-dependent oxidoreductase
LSGDATTVPCDGSGCEAPQSVRENAGSSTGFLVDAASDGYYDLSLRGSGSFRLVASGTDLGAAGGTARVYLHAGINPVRCVGAGVIGALLAWRAANASQARADVRELAGMFETGRLHAVAETRLPLAEVVRAHRLLEDRAVLGRLLLVP